MLNMNIDDRESLEVNTSIKNSVLRTVRKLCNPLTGKGEVTKRLHKITRGGGGVHQKITSDYRGGV